MFRSLYSVYCLCVNVAVLLPPGVNPFAVKYIYHIKSRQDGIGYEGVTGMMRLFIRLSDRLLLGK